MAARGCVFCTRSLPSTLSLSSVDKTTATILGIVRAKASGIRVQPFPALSRSRTGTLGMASRLPIGDVVSQGQSRNNSTYGEAVVALNSLQSNAETIRKSMQNRSEARKHNIPNMVNYLHRVGLTLDDIDKLSVVHVTGTKGKGSTCAFAESILRQYGYKTGLFSSPHLIEARERIRINGRPIDRDLFTSSFWDVFDKLQATKDNSEGSMPHYFSFLTVMALHVFVQVRVDVALLEVGIGGQYDSTNVVATPAVCGIASLDLDHTNLLGHTLPEIAWHKAGIFKRGIPAITVPQPDAAMQVLFNRAKENECPLYVAAPLTLEELSGSQLGIAGQKQLYNASLALQLCHVWLSVRDRGVFENSENPGKMTTLKDIPVRHSSSLSQHMITGLRECRWPGRTQTIHAEGITFYLDGAHTTESIQQCIQWFEESAERERKHLRVKVKRALVFNMTGDRPVSSMLGAVKECGFHMAAFCPNIVSSIAGENIPDQLNLTVEEDTVVKKSLRNRQVWEQLFTKEQDSKLKCEGVLVDNSVLDQSSADRICENGAHNGHSDLNESSCNCVSASFPCISSALKWATQGQVILFSGADVSAGSCDQRLKPEEDHHHHIQVLVTGSLHLIGGVLELIAPHMND